MQELLRADGRQAEKLGYAAAAKRQPKDACHSCGVKYVDHLGLHGTCHALQVAQETLRQISQTCTLKRARALANSTAIFLESQMDTNTK